MRRYQLEGCLVDLKRENFDGKKPKKGEEAKVIINRNRIVAPKNRVVKVKNKKCFKRLLKRKTNNRMVTINIVSRQPSTLHQLAKSVKPENPQLMAIKITEIDRQLHVYLQLSVEEIFWHCYEPSRRESNNPTLFCHFVYSLESSFCY